MYLHGHFKEKLNLFFHPFSRVAVLLLFKSFSTIQLIGNLILKQSFEAEQLLALRRTIFNNPRATIARITSCKYLMKTNHKSYLDKLENAGNPLVKERVLAGGRCRDAARVELSRRNQVESPTKAKPAPSH